MSHLRVWDKVRVKDGEDTLLTVVQVSPVYLDWVEVMRDSWLDTQYYRKDELVFVARPER